MASNHKRFSNSKRSLAVCVVPRIDLRPRTAQRFKHGQFLNKVGNNYQGGPWLGRKEPWAQKITHQDLPLSNLYLTMLQRLGVKAKSFGGSSQTLDEV